MSRKPPPKVGTRSPAAFAGLAVASSNAAQKIDAPLVVFRIDALACRLMNRSALLLFAIAVRSSIGTLRSSSRVSSTRTPSRASIDAFTRRATRASGPFPSRRRALHALVVAAMAGIDRDGADRRRGDDRTPAAAPAAAAARAPAALRCGVGLRRQTGRSPGASSCRPAGWSP